MIDDNGNLYLADAIIALSILFVAMLILNSIVSIPNPTYSDFSHESKNAQDIMEILSGKVDFNDETFLDEITDILTENKNSKKAQREVTQICDEKFEELGLTKYRFIESNKLNSQVLSQSGDFSKAENLSVATRNFDGYSYTLYLW